MASADVAVEDVEQRKACGDAIADRLALDLEALRDGHNDLQAVQQCCRAGTVGDVLRDGMSDRARESLR
ncbi:hypothetical protein [Streptomyces sp. enrichment culture]|uniref:hypothetical protein n=1 Tax=Streptomyces sp. enrichment culture TaxID=1795815 RepID=UPI003F55F21C